MIVIANGAVTLLTAVRRLANLYLRAGDTGREPKDERMTYYERTHLPDGSGVAGRAECKARQVCTDSNVDNVNCGSCLARLRKESK